MSRLSSVSHAYFIGIGGIGMSALAQYLADKGITVSGSDREASPVTDLLASKGIEVALAQTAENVPETADLVVYSEAVWEDNPERMRAKALGIQQRSYFEVLGDVSEDMRTVAVAGTHGKTTTTGMLARILRDAGVSPTAIVGSLVRDFGSNYLSGTSDWLVVEACEYKRDFLTLSPEILVVTNIELDHTDYYKNLEDVQSAFRALMEKVPAHGAIVTDSTHPTIAPILEGLSAPIIDYAKEAGYPSRFPGEFNILNARAASAAARKVLPLLAEDLLRDSLASFEGTWRRFEYKGKTKQGALVYDDYAHHPTAVKKTIQELRNKTKGRIFVAFHPHLYSRTRDLFPDFVTAFEGVDQVYIAPIYPARELDDGTMSNEILAEGIRKEGVSALAGSFAEIQNAFETLPQEGDLVMTMGAGDIYKVADALVA
ncbi:UDP-N-acetylmuramate--L-alanine ligase [Patescibacteria group bacterium]|nr:UDP-N-acetylmuramate--L-alanine ligase [Patescibacteria group bacterium]